jgi:hypothetical protein
MKSVRLYAVIVLLSLVAAVLIAEICLRTVSFPSGTGTGKAARRWVQENWKPINKLGYRDVEIETGKTKRQIVFLGDSFTSGHGVKFDETYYYLAKNFGAEKYQYINAGQNGASTRMEIQNFDDLLKKYNLNIELVVHQYLGNDIDDYVRKAPIYDRSNYFFYRSFATQYYDSLFSAYTDAPTLKKHLTDLKSLHAEIHGTGSKLFFIVFPFLNSDEVVSQSGIYVAPLKDYFLSNCSHGDAMFDVSPIASKLTVGERTVNAMDAHPSTLLHSMIGKVVNDFIGGKIVSGDSIIICK